MGVRQVSGVFVLFVALAACGNDDESPGPWQATYDGVCATAAAVEAGDVALAVRRFANDAHAGLHELAAETDDRAVAAELLRAKQAVEAGLAVADGPTVDTATRLLDATAAAIESTTGDPPNPCPTPQPAFKGAAGRDFANSALIHDRQHP